jgi:hypothetical protein
MSDFISFCPVPNCDMPLESEERNGEIICFCATQGKMTIDWDKKVVGYFLCLD